MIAEYIIRLAVAGLLGAIIGLERELRAKEAGLRTHFLVSVGSALIMLVSQYGFSEVLGMDHVALDPSRVAAQAVSGIGFLGAGMIIIERKMVRGLTTAAGVWATSGIGLTIGSGMYAAGISATILVMIGLELLSMIFKTGRALNISFELESKESVQPILESLALRKISISSYEMVQDSEHPGMYHLKIEGKAKHNGTLQELLGDFDNLPHIISAKLE
ncbi:MULTISPECIES: MgtC/SapB family protein [Paenibacillus]|uniref:Methyltransferase n=1 Tax=Paenibacillus azoreducens TaxID=116718 RepID=A0A920CRJ5_9BACL|nr:MULTISPECIES: MgtC/SapB family protein [Paenibacillus]MBE9915795.1 methyltransferase [Paenibacillus donghaensis]GIO51101.1 methyltransferase [Paenibacillus azoreducens]